ncbi:SLAP domain-containing protein [Sporosarcina sp. ITBMC105]
MLKLAFHPVWERVVDDQEKDRYKRAFELMQLEQASIYITPIRIIQKKKGGISATVFLVNNREFPLELQQFNVQMIDSNGKVIARQTFKENLTIQAYQALPWSFVFNAASMLLNEFDTDSCTILLENT